MSSIIDEWLKDHDNIDEFANELMHKINQRNQYPINTQAYAKSDLYIKFLFGKFQKKVHQLQETLNLLTNLNKLTQRERERRQRLVDNLNDRCKKIEISLQTPVADKRSALFNYSENYQSQQQQQMAPPTVSWNEGLTPTTTTSNMAQQEDNQHDSVTKLRVAQRTMLKEQDQNIDALSAVIIRQKSLAQGIDSELDLHNEILEDIGDAMDDNNQRLLRNTRNIRAVSRKSSTCAYWTVIILLLIAILVVSLVPN